MTSTTPAALPADLAGVQKLVDAWQATASPHGRVPGALWPPIIELLGSHSIATASAHSTSTRNDAAAGAQERAAARHAEPRAQFVELVARDTDPAHTRRTDAEVTICLERRDGLRSCVAVPADEWARVASLVRALAVEP